MSLAELSSPIAVKKALAECDRLGRDEFLRRYGFHAAREYVLQYDGREYDSKAIAGVAHKFQFPDLGPLRSGKFSGGISAGAAAQKLSKLGFTIVGISPGDGWSLAECDATVDSYFDCVRLQSEGKHFIKTQVYKEVASRLNNRSHKAVEYKFQNIEKVLEEEDLPRLGMSTKGNYQRLLRPVVLDYIREHPGIGSLAPHSKPPEKAWSEARVDPPTGRASRTSSNAGEGRKVRVQVGKNDAENKKLGRRGEEWVLELEKQRLTANGRTDLATKVVWVADEEGDGAGYDIRSFDDDGAETYVEVKTTNGGKSTDFFITANELAVSDRTGKAFRLYRLFDFSRDPRFYILTGPLSGKLVLTARSFSACCKG